MKRTLFAPLAVGFLLAAVGATVVGTNRYLAATAEKQPVTVRCDSTFDTHVVKIQSNAAVPAKVYGKLCDTLVIINEDSVLRLMAFGKHDDHKPYDGITEKVISKGQSLSVTMDQLGTFEFHDHLDDSVVGTFTVSKL